MKKAGKNKNKDKKTNRLLYTLCAVDMIVVIVAALFLPQMIFEMQDRYRMMNTEVQARNSLDISQLNITYEPDLNARLDNYFDMKNRIVTAIDYEFTEDSEVAKILETIFQEEWCAPLYYNFIVGATYVYTADYVESLALNVADCKKYLIHNGNYQDGVALMMWYVYLNFEPIGIRIRLLVDTESHTVYYMKITTQEEYDADKKDLAEKMYYMLDMMHSYSEFYYQYYEAHDEISYSEYEAGGIIESEFSADGCMMSLFLPYGWQSAEFLFQVEYKDDTHAEITMGLPAIGEMIPEMLQD